MAKRLAPPPPTHDDVEEETDAPDLAALGVHLYKVTFRRVPATPKEITARTKQFITFGLTEQDAIDRIWNAYQGSSFVREFEHDTASCTFVLGGVFPWGSN